MNDKATRAALLTAKRKDKASENIADYVADLLRQGRASEVTDDLMAQADPQRLHHHYVSGNTGQPMPMDYASRMARAEQMGLTEDNLHGTRAGNDFSAFRGADRYGSRLGRENYVAPNTEAGRELASQFANGEQGRIMPLFTPKPLDTRNPDDRARFEQMMDEKNRLDDFRMKGGYRASGLPGWGDQWAIDTVNEAGAPAMKLHERDWVTSDAVFDPTKMRSQFARFDPRLDHLAHLSASTGGAMDFARHVEAVNRAGGQIAPSKYLPDVPRQVHADGGRVGKAVGGGFGYVPQAALPQLRLAVAQPLPQAQPQAPKAASWINALTDLAVAAKKPEEVAAPAQGFGATMPTGATTAPTSGAAPQTGNMSGFYAPFKSDLDRLIADAPGAVNVTSGYRTPQRQQELWEQHAAKYPDPEVRDNYVARPGSSSHNYGLAADLSFASPEVQQWVHDNAAQYGLQFRMDHEGWHVEPSNLWELRKQMGPPAGYADGGSVGNEGIDAYHGSPHDFDQFDISKLGTGEGAQAYGHGLYFAGNENVAKGYRNALSDTLIYPEGTPDLEKRAGQMALTFSDNTPEGAIGWLGKFRNGAKHTSPALTPELIDAVSKRFSSGDFRPGGHMYKVKLNVGPHELLDWDAKVSEQHPTVMQKIQQFFPDGVPTTKQYGEMVKGGDLYQMVLERAGSIMHRPKLDAAGVPTGLPGGTPERLAKYLLSQGIKGIRYRDAGSRNMTDGDPTHNYVIFHHDHVKVTEKYAYGGEVDDPMFGHHNTSAKGVEVASGLGGIPMPSMAISKAAHPLDTFGDITLMAQPGMVTPSRDTNVWSADTYTGRQPRGDEEFSDPKSIKRAMQADPNFGHMRDITYWHDATNGVTDADEKMKTAQLGVARGVDPKQHASFFDYISDVQRQLGYEAYKNDHMPGLRAYGDIKRVLYPKDAFTASGNRKKPVDYTLENVMKRMKGAAEAGSEGFNYGPGNFRAIHTPKFLNMGDIKSDRGLIIPKEQMEPIKSQFENAYSGLVEKLVQATGRKGFRAYDEAADALTDISKGRKHDWFGDVPPDLVAQVRELGRHASKMPTEYFEAKSKRAIPLSSFPAALVPKSDPESARRLTEAGVKKVMTYGSPEERVAMYRSQPDLMFKNGGKAMALTRRFTKDGAGATMALKSKGK